MTINSTNSPETRGIKDDSSRVSSQFRDKTMDIKDEVNEITRIAREAAAEKVMELRKMGREQARAIIDIVKEKPLTALAIAAGIGLTLGLLRRSD